MLTIRFEGVYMNWYNVIFVEIRYGKTRAIKKPQATTWSMLFITDDIQWTEVLLCELSVVGKIIFIVFL